MNKIKLKESFSEDFKKFFLEKCYYLDQNLTKIFFKKNFIYFNIKGKKNTKNIKKKIILFIKKNIKNIDRTNDEILYKKVVKFKKKTKDPFKEMLDKNYVRKISEGIYSIEGDLLLLKNYLENVFKKLFADLGFQNVKYSGVVPINSLIKNSYLSSFPNHCLFISNIKRDVKKINSVAKLNVNNSSKVKNNLDLPNYILSPTVCFNCFETLKNTKIKNTLKITALENCHRYESLNYKSFERLNIYSMREWIIIGSKNNIEKNLEKFLKKFKVIFNKWNISFRICTASDPFFSNKDIKKKIFQHSNRLKYELQVFLPYEKKWLAVASFNNHLTTMTNSYNIKFKNKKQIYSGCIGVGYERLIYGIFSQKGINKKWKKKF